MIHGLYTDIIYFSVQIQIIHFQTFPQGMTREYQNVTGPYVCDDSTYRLQSPGKNYRLGSYYINTFEDMKEVMRSSKQKGRRYNDQTKKT